MTGAASRGAGGIVIVLGTSSPAWGTRAPARGRVVVPRAGATAPG
ncbi:hypothetical protein QL996_07415 [Planococcus sp. APC 4015]|nr:hypothetical protein [Planococcus sp. APC 4015]